ncbi:MAG TPA: hypothetical protein ENH99_01295 [Candidatus Pacearchaeota archaeon]|nr:hypothetical protein [Candidatus Pacearchaeota archaeon]
MKLPIIVVKLLVLGALFIISNHNIHLLVPEERQVFYDSYTGWLENLFDQSADVTGYVVKFEWLPKNFESSG